MPTVIIPPTDVSPNTGTGSEVLSNSPTLVTPNIGAATGTSLGLTSTTASTSTTTGALTVAGGVGVAGAINAGGNLTVSGTGTSSVAGNLLLGTTTDSGNGKLQLATHTTSAGGIGFGTDTVLYRDAASSLKTTGVFTAVNLVATGNDGNGVSLSIIAGSSFRANGSFYIDAYGASAGITFRTGGSLTTALTITSTQAATFASSLSDGIGNVRSIPQNAQTSAYILAATDNGKHISITTGGVTVNASTLTTGQVVVIFNNSSSSQTITQGASVTMYLAGTTSTGNRTLGSYGVATILCVGTNTYVVTGSGIS